MEHYADPLDRATVEQDRLLEEQLRAARANQEKPLPFTGQCHNCEEGLEDPKRFCDADCRDDYEQRIRFNKPVPRR